ncbi:MAG: argininosuccinate lyase [Sphaerochaetaceae bacterium]|nr:argininosuccinate lyase [Sphaerochaetaceae bacterium]
MKTMWSGRFQKSIAAETNDFNSSLHFDARMVEQDIKGSIAHAIMLGSCGIISGEDSNQIINGLSEIEEDFKTGKINPYDSNAEDIHMFVEELLTNKIGEAGKRLHTARSRNDQVALDIRMYVIDKEKELKMYLYDLLEVISNIASEHTETIMPGYTHLQRAQPISFAFHLMAYAQMFERDIQRIDQCIERTNIMPLGSCALAGTSYPINRELTKSLLGFNSACENAMDGVADRDFLVELLTDISLIMMHLSRFSEEIILWCSWEFKFIELDDAYCTGSSIMPQKKNADIAELVRGKTGRCYGNLMNMLTTLKGLPLAYNKDMQEDKEAVFDSIDTVLQCLPIFKKMIATWNVRKDNMYKAAQKGFINATDVADYLTKKGTPFRTAYKITGEIVAYCIKEDKTLDTLSMDEFKEFSSDFDEDVKSEISLEKCLTKRNSFGGTSPEEVERQISAVKTFLTSK